MTPTRSLAARIAAFGLRDDTDPIEIPPALWEDVLAVLVGERLTGLATAATEAGHLRPSEPQRAELERAHLDATTWTLALERALLHVYGEARAEGIEMIVLKGPALAHGFYPDPSWRLFADIDLLVRTADWRRALALLDRLGFRRALPEPKAGFDERFGKAAVHASADGLSIDLHRTLVLGAHGVWLEPGSLFDRTTSFELAGRELRRLDDTAMFIHACMHASLGWWPPLLQPLRDAVQIASVGVVDWDTARSSAERWRLRAVLHHTMEAAAQTFGVAFPSPATALVRSLSVSRRERRVLAVYATDKRSRGGAIRSMFWAVPGVRAKAALLRDLILPDAAFLAARTANGAKPSYLRRMATPVRWLIRRSN